MATGKQHNAAPAQASAPSATPQPMAVSQPAANTHTPLVPSAHTPTAAQQNPVARQNRPLAPSLPDEPNPNAPQDPTKALAERQRNAISSRLEGAQRASVADSTEGAPAKAPKPARVAATPQTPAGAPAAGAAASGAEAGAPAVVPGADGGGAASPVLGADGKRAESVPAVQSDPYELKAFRRWVEENPEKAQKLGAGVFKIETGEGFIKLQNRSRKVKQEIDTKRAEAEASIQERGAKVASDLQKAEEIAGQVRWLGDMWAASTRKNEKGEHAPDFDMIDEAFKQNTGGMDLDSYLRLRARRGVSNPEAARLRAVTARQEQELAALRGAKPKEPENASQPPATPAPAAAAPASGNPEQLWGQEIPKAHQLREFNGWAAELDKEMAKYHDEHLDEYSVDAEEIADEILQRKLAALAPAPAPAAKPKPANGRPNTPKNRQQAAPKPSSQPIGDGIPSAESMTPRTPAARRPSGHAPGTEENIYDASGDAPRGFKERERWAIERHQRRLRGETVED